MKIEFHNPPTLAPTFGWTQVVTQTGGKTVLVSGQPSVDNKGQTVGKGDLKAQTIQVYENIKAGLESVGASFKDVIKMSAFVVGLKPEHTPTLREIRSRYINMATPPASTVVGVEALVGGDWLIEIEAIAVLAE